MKNIKLIALGLALAWAGALPATAAPQTQEKTEASHACCGQRSPKERTPPPARPGAEADACCREAEACHEVDRSPMESARRPLVESEEEELPEVAFVVLADI